MCGALRGRRVMIVSPVRVRVAPSPREPGGRAPSGSYATGYTDLEEYPFNRHPYAPGGAGDVEVPPTPREVADESLAPGPAGRERDAGRVTHSSRPAGRVWDARRYKFVTPRRACTGRRALHIRHAAPAADGEAGDLEGGANLAAAVAHLHHHGGGLHVKDGVAPAGGVLRHQLVGPAAAPHVPVTAGVHTTPRRPVHNNNNNKTHGTTIKASGLIITTTITKHTGPP
eukprot:1175759-Prorocentrum_minimum.AAC.3